MGSLQRAVVIAAVRCGTGEIGARRERTALLGRALLV